MHDYRRLRRAEASVYLKQRWGIDRKPSTLAKLACIGGGRRFESGGRIPVYPEPELDQWAENQLSPLKSSTSDCLTKPKLRECSSGMMGRSSRREHPSAQKALPTQ